MQVQATIGTRGSAGLAQFFPAPPAPAAHRRRAAAPAPCWVIRLAQRADCGPVHALDEADPMVFEACSALMLQCWRSGIRARPVPNGRFEIAVRMGGVGEGSAIQSVLCMLHLWNQRLRDSHWQFVLEG